MSMEKLMAALGLGSMTEQPVSVDGGLLHKMYHVITTGGEYAVKALNPEIMKRPEALSNMIRSERIARAFAEVIPLVGAIEAEGKQIQHIDEEYYLVFPWLEGASVFGKEITPKHCREIGRTLGKIHRENLQLEDVTVEENAFGMFDWDRYVQCIKETKAGDCQWTEAYRNAVEDIKNWNKRACDAGEYLSRKMVISHGDLDPKNVMWSGDAAYVIDWESAGYVNPFQELLEVINYWADDGAGRLDKERFDALVDEYRRYMDTGKADWSVVCSGSYMGMLGWLEYNVKRALGIEAADADEAALGEKQVVWTIRELYAYQEKQRQIEEWIV